MLGLVFSVERRSESTKINDRLDKEQISFRAKDAPSTRATRYIDSSAFDRAESTRCFILVRPYSSSRVLYLSTSKSRVDWRQTFLSTFPSSTGKYQRETLHRSTTTTRKGQTIDSSFSDLHFSMRTSRSLLVDTNFFRTRIPTTIVSVQSKSDAFDTCCCLASELVRTNDDLSSHFDDSTNWTDWIRLNRKTFHPNRIYIETNENSDTRHFDRSRFTRIIRQATNSTGTTVRSSSTIFSSLSVALFSLLVDSLAGFLTMLFFSFSRTWPTSQ